MEEKFKYTAFISYSHADQKVVKWLHHALENYRVPVKLVGKETPSGKVPGKFKPIFRDRDDLSAAANLTDTIKDALKNSKFLIVVCSPNAARSKWVEKEIREFRKLRSQDHVLCLIADADPSGQIPIFPPALWDDKQKHSDFEPIAADMRVSGDGKRMAKLKLISGLLGVELDTLVQRDAKRRQIQMGVMAATFSITTIVLSVLLYMATEARKEAEMNRQRAEDLVTFMLGDLRDKLEPIGSLQLMDTIAIEALDYYGSIDPEKMTTEGLRRRSQVVLMLGETQELRGNSDAARTAFEEASSITGELLKREPDNAQLIYDHAQGVYRMGFNDLRLKNYEAAESYFQDYAEYADRLVSLEPDNQVFRAEVGHAYSNLGIVLFSQAKFPVAQKDFERALEVQVTRAKENEYSQQIQIDLAKAYAWLAEAKKELGAYDEAGNLRQSELAIYTNLLNKNNNDRSIWEALAWTYRALGTLAFLQGNQKNSLEYFDRGIGILQNLSASDRENTAWKEKLAQLFIDKARAFIAAKDYSGAENTLSGANRLASDLLAVNPDLSSWSLINFRAKALMAETLLGSRKKRKEGLEMAKTLASDFYQKFPPESRIAETHFLSAEILAVLAEAYRRNGDRETAKENWQTVVRILEPFESTGGVAVHTLLPTARAQSNGR